MRAHTAPKISAIAIAAGLLCAPGLRADIVTVFENSTGAVVTTGRSATFDSLATGDSIANYSEDKLDFKIAGAVDGDGIVVAPGGFSSGFLYPNGGAMHPLTITTTDDALLYGIQFDLGSGAPTEQASGDTLPLAFELLNGTTVVYSSTLDAIQTSSGYLFGIQDVSGFTSLKITNCSGDPCALTAQNSIAIDNVAADLTQPVPEPSAWLPLAFGLLSLMAVVWRRKTPAKSC